jgi:lipopolysaccharide/colanic/teichoic acid biosynthesis glycosyltransferase
LAADVETWPSSTDAPITTDHSTDHPVARPIEAPRRSRRFAKRSFDLVVALVLALLTLPIVLLLLVGSAVAYRTNPIFVHHRVGLGGREFKFVKVRSLPRSTPVYADKHQLGDLSDNRWGRALRRSKLDELPQLWHVVFGRMSLIGPRPEMPALSASFDRYFVERRLTVKPGCSGLWQISPDNADLIGEAPHWDLHYVQHWTVRLDLWVILVTVASVPGWMSLESLAEIPSWTGATGTSSPSAAHVETSPPAAAAVEVTPESLALHGPTFLSIPTLPAIAQRRSSASGS